MDIVFCFGIRFGLDGRRSCRCGFCFFDFGEFFFLRCFSPVSTTATATAAAHRDEVNFDGPFIHRRCWEEQHEARDEA